MSFRLERANEPTHQRVPTPRTAGERIHPGAALAECASATSRGMALSTTAAVCCAAAGVCRAGLQAGGADRERQRHHRACAHHWISSWRSWSSRSTSCWCPPGRLRRRSWWWPSRRCTGYPAIWAVSLAGVASVPSVAESAPAVGRQSPTLLPDGSAVTSEAVVPPVRWLAVRNLEAANSAPAAPTRLRVVVAAVVLSQHHVGDAQRIAKPERVGPEVPAVESLAEPAGDDDAVEPAAGAAAEDHAVTVGGVAGDGRARADQRYVGQHRHGERRVRAGGRRCVEG